ncbi:MAG: hypothetical protein P8130_12175 [Deltaproteobacteria bacterium]
MRKPLKSFVMESDIPFLMEFLFGLEYGDIPIILHNDIILAFQKFTEENNGNTNYSTLWRFLRKVQEIIHLGQQLVIVYRHRRASCRIYQLHQDEATLLALDTRRFLTIKETRPALRSSDHGDRSRPVL